MTICLRIAPMNNENLKVHSVEVLCYCCKWIHARYPSLAEYTIQRTQANIREAKTKRRYLVISQISRLLQIIFRKYRRMNYNK